MTNARAMTFDAAPGARLLFKERALWTAIMGLFFFLIYGSSNEIGSLTAPHSSVLWDWERNLPFVPELILPYMSSDLVFVIAFLMASTRKNIQKLALRSGLAIVISALFFLAVPLAFSFERPEITGWPKFWFDLLSLDKPYNQFPSLHIALGYLAWHTITGRMNGFAKTVTTIWFLLILTSTLLVYQHHFIDLPGGAAVAVLVFRLIPESGTPWITLGFVTPRHLHMALRYLVLATVAVVIAFSVASESIPGAVVSASIALSLILVSGSYVLGANGFLHKQRGGYSLFIWLLYWPYLAGSFLNWRYWQARVPLMSEVETGVWIGARPGDADWEEIRQRGIETVIDLVPELPVAPPHTVTHTHIPLLDIAIPDPAILDDIAKRIDAAAKSGGVLVHCALGMSRSVLAICAWLMRNGRTAQHALEVLDRARPDRVTRPYIAISLELYEDYLRRIEPVKA